MEDCAKLATIGKSLIVSDGTYASNHRYDSDNKINNIELKFLSINFLSRLCLRSRKVENEQILVVKIKLFFVLLSMPLRQS